MTEDARPASPSEMFKLLEAAHPTCPTCMRGLMILCRASSTGTAIMAVMGCPVHGDGSVMIGFLDGFVGPDGLIDCRVVQTKEGVLSVGPSA